MALIAQMIGRNEADRHLEEVLIHLRPIVDAIVFTDDCSEDNTLEIARKYGDFVYESEEPLFTVDEGRLRNNAWRNLQNHAVIGDWILAIDCDEKLWATNPKLSLDKLMRQEQYDVINIRFYHMWNETHYRVDKLWAPTNSSRLFRYYLGGHINDRKMASGSEPQYVQTLIRRGKYMVDSGLIMQHLGYVRDEDKIAKHARYTEHDGGDFHAGAHIESIVDENPTLMEWVL